MWPVKLHYAPRARNDIADIHEYIAQHNPRAATAVVRGIRSTCRLLARYPRLGRATDIAGVRALALVRYPYLIYYAIGTDEVSILHVRHGARSAPEQSDL
jgi:plasmid stabilization system protein ParE